MPQRADVVGTRFAGEGRENARGPLASAVMPIRPPGVDSPPGVVTVVADGRALVTVACYVVVCLAVALWAARRRDVT